ncbi:MAG: hemC [Gemmatimonadetes bacterium]|nr:hemC [Gemmatimonadota bacterium]
MLKIGTRSSELALRQARTVQAALTALGVESELVTFKTVGDKRLDEPLSSIGAKGLFTKELETALLKKKIDLAVHSLKDLPTDSPAGLVVSGVLVREDPRDVLVISKDIKGQSLDDLPPGSRVGTSSLRRRAQLLALRPDLEVAELRGNVPTRLKKVDEGRVHAAILAAAGLHRLDARQHITCYLDIPAWLPAAGQGAIAIQIRDADAEMKVHSDAMNDPRTMLATRAERAFLAALEGGCQVPIGALVMRSETGAALHGFISDVHGTRVARGSIELDANDPELSGIRLANQLRSQGATEILEGLRRATHVMKPQPE